jgi:uncharacterized protein (TIGR03435 family)
MRSRVTFLGVFIVGLGSSSIGHSQASSNTTPPQAFEVASVKPNLSGGRGGLNRPAPGGLRYAAYNVSLKLLISEAYLVKLDQVVGGPDWIDRNRYDVNAKADRPSSGQDLRLMLQSLLADRFKLQFHRQAKELPVFALTLSKDGPKLREAESLESADPVWDQSMEPLHHLRVKGQSITMPYFAWRLGRLLDRPVIDQTTLKSAYDFDLVFVEDVPAEVAERAVKNGRPIDTRPSVFEALQNQLGLRLEARKGLVDVIMIDHAETPTAN